MVDAKYKAERHEGYPNADAYQMLAYCTALRLDRGHLVYAEGDERPRVYDIHTAGVLVIAHALDLSGTPSQILDRVRVLAAELLESPCLGVCAGGSDGEVIVG
jgi:5-methylcytosine-specific restriction enzyme subunit McrC